MKFIRLLSTLLSLVMLLGTFAMLLTACGDTPDESTTTAGDMRATPSCLYDSPNGEGLYLDLKAGSHTIVISAGDADSCVDYIYLLCEK